MSQLAFYSFADGSWDSLTPLIQWLRNTFSSSASVFTSYYIELPNNCQLWLYLHYRNSFAFLCCKIPSFVDLREACVIFNGTFPSENEYISLLKNSWLQSIYTCILCLYMNTCLLFAHSRLWVLRSRFGKLTVILCHFTWLYKFWIFAIRGCVFVHVYEYACKHMCLGALVSCVWLIVFLKFLWYF